MIRLAFSTMMLVATWAAHADPVLQDDFSSYGEGEQPLLPSDGNHLPWRFDDGWSAEVQREDEKSFLQMKRPSGLPYATFGRSFTNPDGAHGLTLRMRLRLPAGAEASDYFMILGNHDENPHSGAVKVRLHQYRLSVYHGSENAITITPKPLTPNAWYAIEISVDYASQQYRVKLSEDNSPEVSFDSGMVPFTMASTVLDQLLFRPQESRDPAEGAMEWDIADLSITAEN